MTALLHVIDALAMPEPSLRLLAVIADALAFVALLAFHVQFTLKCHPAPRKDAES